MSEISAKSAKDSDKKIETIEYEIETDEKGNPIIPEGWTFLTHGSNLDKWDKSKLGHDFMVGNGIINGKEVSKLPLCCIERNDAKFNFERDGSNTAKAYGGKGQSFEIRVLFYKNPRTNLEEEIKKKLDPREVQDILKYYMYQDGRHPAIPTGTKLHFLKTGDFDEITNTNGNLILWYVPDQYLTQYLGDVQRSKEDKRVN